MVFKRGWRGTFINITLQYQINHGTDFPIFSREFIEYIFEFISHILNFVTLGINNNVALQ